MTCLLQHAGRLRVQSGYAGMHAWYGTTHEQPAIKAPICGKCRDKAGHTVIGKQAYRDGKLQHLSVGLHGLISQAIAHAALQECVVGHTVWPQACFLQLCKPARPSAWSKGFPQGHAHMA